MRPTTDEALAGANRLLRVILADANLPAEFEDSLQTVLRLVQQAQKTASAALPFLTEDSHANRELLESLRSEVPQPTAGQIDARLNGVLSEQVFDEAVADRVNANLRALLLEVIRALPASNTDARERIRAHLISRTEREPI